MSEAEDRMRRVIRLLPRTTDPVAIVLKGQLLLEETLFVFVSGFCRKSASLEDARLSFSQLIALFEALSGEKPNDDLVRFLKATGALRNKLAHKAEVPNLDRHVDALMLLMIPDLGHVNGKRLRAKFLRHVFAFACGKLDGFAEGFHAAKS